MNRDVRNTWIIAAVVVSGFVGLAVYDRLKPTPADLRERAENALVLACADIVSDHIPTPASFELERGHADLRTGVTLIRYDRQNLMGAVIRVPAECRFRPVEDGPLQLDGLEVEAHAVDQGLVDIWNLGNHASRDWIWPETP